MKKNTRNKEIYDFLNDYNTEISKRVVELQYRLYPSYLEKYGEEGKQICIRDVGYLLPFLAESIISEDHTVFTDYIDWLKILFRGLNFKDEMTFRTLECVKEIMKSEFSEEKRKLIADYIDAGLKQMDKSTPDPESYINPATPLGKIAGKYLEHLLEGKRNDASKLILQLVKDGITIKEIYLEIFQKTQYEVGRLWLKNNISVAQEHFCSAATQMVMSQLYPYIFSTARKAEKSHLTSLLKFKRKTLPLIIG